MEKIDNLVVEIALLATEVRELKKLLASLNISQPAEKFISRKELSKRLSLSEWKIAEMTEEKTIPHIRAGKKYMYDYEEVLKSIGVKKRK